MLTVSPETVCYIVVKAREFAAAVESGDLGEGSNPADDADVDALEDREDDPTGAELAAALEALNEDEMIELLALDWLGRGETTDEDWDDALAEARDRYGDGVVNELLATPLLGDYLEEGLARLGYSCEEFEIDRL